MQAFIYYAMLVFFVLGSIVITFQIDQPRDPITRPVAFFSLVFNTLLIMGTYTLYKG